MIQNGGRLASAKLFLCGRIIRPARFAGLRSAQGMARKRAWLLAICGGARRGIAGGRGEDRSDSGKQMVKWSNAQNPGMENGAALKNPCRSAPAHSWSCFARAT